MEKKISTLRRRVLANATYLPAYKTLNSLGVHFPKLLHRNHLLHNANSTNSTVQGIGILQPFGNIEEGIS
jgi:hypothetical protein